MTEETKKPTRRKITLTMNIEIHRQLKIAAALDDTDVSNLIEKISQDFLTERGIRPSYCVHPEIPTCAKCPICSKNLDCKLNKQWSRNL